MNKARFTLILLFIGVIASSTWYVASNDLIGKFFNETEPDFPARFGRDKDDIDKAQYLMLRNEHLDMLRGFDTAKPDSRLKAVRAMEASEAELGERGAGNAWRSLGPAPIPIGTTNGNSGRTTAIVVHPTDPNTVYAGAAQGGVYRSLDGGQHWTPIMDSAATLAIGAIAMAPSDPTTLYVGTGESSLCGSGCYIGIGIYRISNADTNPVLTGPLNKNAANADIFSGRSISEILVHPTDPNTIFVSTTTGVTGIAGQQSTLPLPALGVYRSTNAMSASPVFSKLGFGGTFGDRSITDLVMEPGEPNHIYASCLGAGGGDGGVYYSANALDAVPTFSQLLSTTLTGSASRVELAATKVEGVTTVFAASGEGTGSVYKSVDAAPFTLTVDNNFCNPQCFYDIAVAVDPTDASRVYLGGSPTLVFGRSTNGGTSFTNSSSGLHVDTQSFAIAPSDPTIMYFGSDGGIWRTNNVRATGAIAWSSLNNSTYSATQFMGIALHPIDRNYTLGGTQDNGTEFLAPDGLEWIRSDGGDGGFAVIDQTSPSTTAVTAYHTYYNQTNSQIGYSKATSTVPPGDPNWGSFFGCGGTANGINCADATLFYAPMVGGPVAADSNGADTLYFGTNRLYRSADKGVTMVDVSGGLGSVSNPRVSAIAIAPQDDNVRMMGSTIGRVYLSTTAGATVMNNVTGSIPARYIGRIAIDPFDSNIAYVALNGYGLADGQHIWKTTNLLTGTPTWVAFGTGIPDTPVNALTIDRTNTQTIYAGTDVGVFRTENGGTTWTPFNDGLPKIAVFGMAVHPNHRVLRIATHGRGMYEIDLPTNASNAIVSDFDGDHKSDLAVFRGTEGNWYKRNSSNGADSTSNWGVDADKIVPGDYDGDAKTDLAVFRPSEGNWYLSRSGGTIEVANFGLATDQPVAGDYNGDGSTDIAVFRPSTGTWYLRQGPTTFVAVQFGASGDRPAPGDYDGDGTTDVAVFRPSTGTWYINGSTAGFSAVQFGVSSDLIVPGDYDGDSKTDIAVFRPSNGHWYLNRSADGLSIQQWGVAGDTPAPGDFDGDGQTDLSVFRPAVGGWFRIDSSSGSFIQTQFGAANDRPVPAAYVPVQ